MLTRLILLALAGQLCTSLAAALSIPAATAYLAPDQGGAEVNDNGISGWTNPNTQARWYGNFQKPGAIEARLQLKAPKGKLLEFTLSHGNTRHVLKVEGEGDQIITANAGVFELNSNGYHEFTLARVTGDNSIPVEILALELTGEPAESAHFNLKPRRNAASVHLVYPVAKETKVAGFYCEMTGVDEPLYTYYMACGWHRGYFGMQVNSATERRIIFSVWDSGNEGVDRAKVAATNRVQLVAKGAGVYSGDFGNEGTGGHSHLKFQWKTGEKQRFFVTAKPADATHTIYSGYYFRPDTGKWMLISSWNSPKEGGYMHGLYSFSENFGGENGHLRRKALYGNQWIQNEQGQWTELTTTTFSHDATGKKDRLDRFMGLEANQFFLSHGGFVDGFTEYGAKFQREPQGQPPVIDLP